MLRSLKCLQLSISQNPLNEAYFVSLTLQNIPLHLKSFMLYITRYF